MPSALGQNTSATEKQREVGDLCTFICAVCGDGFSQYQNVLRHMSIHGPLDSFSFDGSSNGFEVPREYVLQDNGTLTVLNGSIQSEYPKRPSSPGLLPSHLSCPINPLSPSQRQQSTPKEVLQSKLLEPDFDNSHGDSYYCEVCSRTFDNLQSLHRHQRYRNEAGYRCTLCCKFFKGRPDLKKHFQNHTFENFHCCTSCGKRFVKANALKNHITQCHTSTKSYGVSENNQDHIFEKTYTCKRCKLAFFWLTDFKIHLYYQCKGKKVSAAFKIETASKITKDNQRTCNGTSAHARNGHIPNLGNASDEPDPRYRCGLCGEQFPELNALKKHHLTHQEKVINPTQKIVKPKQLKVVIPKGRHSIRNNIFNGKKLKTYHCKFCRCVFRNSNSLGQHIRYHKGSTCEICGQRFHQGTDLIRHLLSHKKEMKSKLNTGVLSADQNQSSSEEQNKAFENYKCSECGKKFSVLCVYRIHLRFHKKEGNTTVEHKHSSTQDQKPCIDESKELTNKPLNENLENLEKKYAVNANIPLN